MRSFRVVPPVEQLAEFLRGEIQCGELSGTMPGVNRLAREMGISSKTVVAAVKKLEREGMLHGHGPRHRRRIVPRGGTVKADPLRVGILLGEAGDRSVDYQVELRHQLIEAGHGAFYAPKDMLELGMDLRRIARMVTKTEADAWVVTGGSRGLLEWFVERETPVFALFGRRRGLPIAAAGPNKPPAMAAATRRLAELGHHRIVLLARRARRLPEPGASERAFLDELVAHGIPASSYNLPDWEEEIDGFDACLAALFEVTPPTALIIDEVSFYVATQQFLMNRGLRVPHDVSLVCTDGDPHFAWCLNAVAHIHWDSHPVVRRIVHWADNVSHGNREVRQTLTKAEFIEGGTIGRPRR